jgi:hypothetical protein
MFRLIIDVVNNGLIGDGFLPVICPPNYICNETGTSTPISCGTGASSPQGSDTPSNCTCDKGK